MWKNLFLISLFALLLSCNQRKNVEFKLEKELQQILKEAEVPGINLAIVMPDDKIITVAAGYSDIEKQILMKPDDKMFSGSTGKTFCAAIILQLIDEGKLNIDDSLSQYFGGEHWYQHIKNADLITIRMLLNHTSSIPRYVFDKSIWETMHHQNPNKIWTGAERLAFVFDQESAYLAGKGWGHSDTNYIILGMLVEKLTNNEYYAELSKRILKPYNFTNTSPANSRRIEGLITGYSAHTNDFLVPEKVLLDDGKFAFNPQMEFTGGGIACSAADLARWGKMYCGGKLFSEESHKLMSTPCGQMTDLPDNADYGFANFIWNEDGQISYGHTGFFPGYLAIVEYIPELDISIGMQWNTDKNYSDKTLHQYINDIKKIIKQK